MKKELILLIGSVVFTLLLIVGFAFWQGGKGGANGNVLDSVMDSVEINPPLYNVGEIALNGGNLVKTFEVKNTTQTAMKLKRIATSCMCTKVKVRVGDKETREFGMEGAGDKNPPVNLEIPAKESVLVTAIFDPAAHGPKGAGPFDRSVYLYFSDPAGVIDLKFSGTVVNR